MTRLCAVALTSLALATGCTDDPDPDPAPQPTPSPTVTSADPPLAPPNLPEAAQGAGDRAARVFTRHYFQLLNYAIATGDHEKLTEASAEGCGSCAGFAAYLDKVYGRGGHIESDGWRVAGIRFISRSPQGEPTFHLRVEQPIETTYGFPGSEPSPSTQAVKYFYAYIRRIDSVWRMRDLQLTEERF